MRSSVAAVLGGLALLCAGVGCKDDRARSDAADTDGTDTDGTDSSAEVGTGDDTDSSGDDGELDGIDPNPGGMRRLLSHEYRRSIELMLGSAAAAAASPPTDTPQEGWDAMGASLLSLDAFSVEQYERSATEVALAAVANPSRLAETVPCVVDGPMDESCYQSVATDLGRFAFRRSLETQEVNQLVQVANQARAWGNGDFVTGLRYQLMAILQAPSFLYLHNVGEPDADTGYRRLTATELASRMSFFLLGRTPDLALLDAAEAGELETQAQIRARAQAMIASEEARVAVFTFFEELFRLRYLQSVEKDLEAFPMFTPALAEAMRQESLHLVDDIVWTNDGDYRDILTAPYTYVNADLAQHYELAVPADIGSSWVKIEWPSEQNRAGYLSQGAFLTVHAHQYRNSPSKRGKYVQLAVLCTAIPPPPPDLEVDLPEPQEGQTLRDALIQHKLDPACSSCHNPMDEVGFAYEFFDAVGAYRTLDNGQPIVASGELQGLGMWAHARELGTVLKNDARTPACLITNLLRGNLGQLERPGIQPALVELGEAFADSGYSMKSLMVEMASSPMFRYVDEPQ
jgi:hypothetical protein